MFYTPSGSHKILMFKLIVCRFDFVPIFGRLLAGCFTSVIFAVDFPIL